MKNSYLFHKEFKLNENSFESIEELITFSEKISVETNLFLKEWFNNNSFIEVNTSGSTGKPKTIQLQKKHMKQSAMATGLFFNLPEKSKVLLCMPLKFIAGKMMLIRAITLGWHLDIIKPTSYPLKTIENEYDFSAMVPLQLNNSLEKIQKIKKLIVGGGIVSKALISKIQSVKTIVFATYGMTETITHIAIKQLNNFEKTDAENNFYKTLPDVFIKVDSRGCLVINAPKISDNEIVTNDLVEIISETKFEWLGRFDNIINSGGIKLIPEQIEKKLSEIIDNRFFVFGLPDDILGEKLVLIIEGRTNENLIKKIKQLNSLSKFEHPKSIFFLSQFIETETQKINRKKTVELLKNTY